MFLGSTIFLNWEYETIAVEISQDVKNLKKKKSEKTKQKTVWRQMLFRCWILLKFQIRVQTGHLDLSNMLIIWVFSSPSLFSLSFTPFLIFYPFPTVSFFFFLSFILLTLFCLHYSFYFVHVISSISLLIIHVLLFSSFPLCTLCKLIFSLFFSTNVYLLDSFHSYFCF